jgi:hypothetical protein
MFVPRNTAIHTGNESRCIRYGEIVIGEPKPQKILKVVVVVLEVE